MEKLGCPNRARARARARASFTVVITARMFATAIHFRPSLIFAGKARSLPLEGSPKSVSTLVGSNY